MLAQYLYNCRASVRLSVRPIIRPSHAAAAGLLLWPGGHHGQFTRLGLRACERQPWLEERVGYATQPCSHFNQLIRHGSSSERVGVYCKPCGDKGVATGTGGGYRWQCLVMTLHTGGSSVMVRPGRTLLLQGTMMWTCDVCGRPCDSRIGLFAHRK